MVGPDGKCRGSILVTIDSCFSGNATRAADDLVSRGRGWDPALDGERPPLSRGGPSAARDDGGGLLGRDEAKRKGYVVLSACRADQTAKEIKGMGAFTCELVQAMPRATSYRDLFEAVSASVRSEIRGQDPQGEGDLDQVLFGDQILPPRQYYLAQVTPEGKLELPVGEVQGATVGSVFAMYRPQGDVSDEKQCIGQARVRAVGETTSELELIGNLAGGATKAALNGARAVEVAHSFGADALRLLLRTKSKRAADLGRLDVVVTAGVTDKDYDVRLDDHPRTPGKLLLATRDGRPLASVADDDRAAEAIRTELVAEWRWRFLCRLRNGATRKTVRIAVRVVPVAVETNEAGLVTKVLGDRKDRPPTSGGETILYAGDYVAVELRNQSEHPVWATVLDLTADGSVGPVYPHPEMPGLFKPVPADGEWYRLPYPFVFQLGDHLGREIFRVIATAERADFSPLLCERAATGRGVGDADALRGIPPEVNPLGRLLLFAATGARGDPADVPMGTWDTAQATFEVREATK
jgi:hypothetical protein